MMIHTRAVGFPAWFVSLHLVFAALLMSGCGKKDMYRDEPFRADTPFSARIQGRGEDVCWSVKRAFLTQGYMLERGADPLIMTGTKESQPDSDTNVTMRLQATCVDNRDGTSTVFATASQEVSKLQTVMHSMTAGVSIATISVPSGTDRSLRVQKRETVQDRKFYERFYALVQQYAHEERRANAANGRSADSRR